MARDHRSAYERRNDAARAMGYAGYSERRRARETGRGLLGADQTDPKVLGNRRVFTLGDGRTVVKLTPNNRGQASVRSRGREGEAVTISWDALGKSGPIPMSRTVLWDDLAEWDDLADFAEAEAGDAYGGDWSGAVGSVQVTL